MTFYSLLRNNWHLGLVMLAFLGMGLYGMRDGSKDAAAKASPRGPSRDLAQERPAAERASTRISEADRARAFIEKYKAKLEDDPQSEDAPGLMSAMGNLYRQKLGDYEQAAQCYERLLYDYPKWDGKRKAYIQLVACYEKLGDAENLRATYRRMMEAFPSDSQEHLFAKAQLGL